MPDFRPQQQPGTVGDYSQYFQFGALGVLKSIAEQASYYGNENVRAANAPSIQQLGEAQQAQLGQMTPGGRRTFTSEIGSPEFWRSPVGWATAQTMGMSPYLLASVLPAVATGGTAGLLVGAATGGVLSDADLISSASDAIQNQSDEELAARSVSFADDLKAGKSPTEARQNLLDLTLGPGKHAAAIALGLASGGLGVPRAAVGAVGRLAGREALPIAPKTGGFVRGAVTEGAAGAGSEFGEEFGQSILSQSALAEAGLKPTVDIGEATRAGLTGAVVGGVTGAPLGAIERFGGGSQPAKPSTAPPPASIQQATTTPSGPTGGPATPVAPTDIPGRMAAWEKKQAGIAPRLEEWQRTQQPPTGPPSMPGTRVVRREPTPTPFTPATPAPEGVVAAPTAVGAIPEVFKNVLPSALSPAPEVQLALQSKIQPTAAAPAPAPGAPAPGAPAPAPAPTPPPAAQGAIPEGPQAAPAPGPAPMRPIRRELPAPAPRRPAAPVPLPRGEQPTFTVTPTQLPPGSVEREVYFENLTKAQERRNLPAYGAISKAWPTFAGEVESQGAKERRREARAAEREARKAAGEPTGNISKEARAKLTTDKAIATELYAKYNRNKETETPEQIVARARLALGEALARNVDITRAEKLRSNEMVWLKEAQDLVEDANKEGGTSPTRIQEFKARELDLEMGRETRRIEGEIARRPGELREGEIAAGEEVTPATQAKKEEEEEPDVEEITEEEYRELLKEEEPEITEEEITERIKEERARRVGKSLGGKIGKLRVYSTKTTRPTGKEFLAVAKRLGITPAQAKKKFAAETKRETAGARKKRLVKEATAREEAIAKERERAEAVAARPEEIAKARAEKTKETAIVTKALKKKGIVTDVYSEWVDRHWDRVKSKLIKAIGGNVGKHVTFDGVKYRIISFNKPPQGEVHLTSAREIAEKPLLKPGESFPEASVTLKNLETGERVTWTESEVTGVPKQVEPQPPKAEAKAVEEPKKVIYPKSALIKDKYELRRTKGPSRRAIAAAGAVEPFSLDDVEALGAQAFLEGKSRDEYKAYAKTFNHEDFLLMGRRWLAGFDKAAQQARAVVAKPPLAATNTRAEQQGAAAFAAGQTREDNPYRMGARVNVYGEPLSMSKSTAFGDIRGLPKGRELAAAINVARTERMARRGEITKRRAILEKRWDVGFRQAERAARMPKLLPKAIPPKLVAIKQRSLKQRLSSARMQVDKNASEAQRAAGNARGGLLNFHGLELMLQYVKGMTRFGNKLPADYGHIKGTKGADGQPVDFYIGPNITADTIYVVDQIDPDTGVFDEHKAMVGFDNANDALETYYSVFGDKSGYRRVGDITPMTIPEFKAWLDTQSKKPAGAATIAEMPEPTSPPAEPSLPGDILGKVNELAITRHPYSRIQGWVNEWRNDVSLTEMPPSAQEKFTDLTNRIEEAIADTSVYVVPQENMVGRSGFYDPENNIIVLAARREESTVQRRVAFHEAVHAALVKAVAVNPALRAILDQAATEFRAALNAAGITREFNAFKNVDEFVAEFVSNASMRQRLVNFKASDTLKQAYRATQPTKGPLRSLWDVIRRAIGRFFGLTDSREDETLLDIVLATTSDIQATMQGQAPGPMTAEELLSRATPSTGPWTGRSGGDQLFFGEGAQDFAKGALNAVTPYGSNLRQTRVYALWARGMDQLAQLSKSIDPVFGRAARTVYNANEQRNVIGRELELQHQPYMKKWVEAERKYRGTDNMEKLGEYLIAETEARARGDIPISQQPHLKGGLMRSAWARGQHPKLEQLWKALPADLQALRTETMKLTDNEQKEMALDIIRNQILTAIGVADEGLVQRLFDKETTEEDKNVVSPQLMEAIKGTRALTNYKGPYYPEMRFGDYVVTGTYSYVKPSNAKQMEDNENIFEFSGKDAKEQAMKFAGSKKFPGEDNPYSTVKTVHVDPDTGDTHIFDEEDNELKKVPKENTEVRYRVTVANRLVEFFDTRKEAQDFYADNSNIAGLTLNTAGPREFNPNEEGGREFLAHDVRHLVDVLEKQPGFQTMPQEGKDALRQTLIEMSLRFYGSTRIQSRRLPRRHVKGASTDFGKVMDQFIKATSGYRAKLQVTPELNAGLKAMKADINTNVKTADAKQSIYNEMYRRITDKNKQGPPTKFDIAANRVMAWTFANYLLSPSYSLNNALQVIMIGGPKLWARFGMGRGNRALYNAYKMMQVKDIVAAGAKGTYTAAKGEGPANFFTDMYNRAKTQGQRDMLMYLKKTGTIAPDAGLEFSRTIGAGYLGNATDILQNVARAMPAAIETMNRVVLGIASYDLELAKNGGNHQAAMEYAQEIVNLTQGNYSRTNMPTLFHKNALASIAFQFKNYGQTIYGNIGHHLGVIMRDGTSPAERKEAAKALGYLAASHVIMAGTLGLPGLEAVRWLLFAAGIGYEEFENAERELAGNLFGDYMGEIISRGLPRAFGIDISGRVGAQNLLTFGQPRDDSEQAWYAYVGALLGGASTAMTMEVLGGVTEMRYGNFGEGLQRMMPIKMLADAVKAYRLATEGKKTETGYQVIEPVNLGEAALTAFGYTPARHAEISEARQYFFKQQSRVDEERNRLQRAWAQSSGGDRYKLMGQIEDFNRGRSRDEQLTPRDLNNYKKRRAGEEVIGGIRVTRRNRGLIESLNTYNTQ